MSFLACLDLESVLVPELWPILSEAFGIEELLLTTRQIADKKALNAVRLAALKKHKISLTQINSVMAKVQPLAGAPEFLRWLYARVPLVIVSDCYLDLAAPVLKKLGDPAIICHQWRAKNNRITALPMPAVKDTKGPVAKAFQKKGLTVIAMGDSLNDLGMLTAADLGLFYRPSPRAVEMAPTLPICKNYAEAKRAISKFIK